MDTWEFIKELQEVGKVGRGYDPTVHLQFLLLSHQGPSLLSYASPKSVTFFETPFLSKPLAASPLILYQPSGYCMFLLCTSLSWLLYPRLWNTAGKKALSYPLVSFDNIKSHFVQSLKSYLFHYLLWSNPPLAPIPLFVSRWPCPCTFLRKPRPP